MIDFELSKFSAKKLQMVITFDIELKLSLKFWYGMHVFSDTQYSSDTTSSSPHSDQSTMYYLLKAFHATTW